MKIYEEYVVTLRRRDPADDVPPAHAQEEVSEVSSPEEASETPSYVERYWHQRTEYAEANSHWAKLEIEYLTEERDEARDLARARSQWWSDYWRERTQRECQSSDITEQSCGCRY